MDTTEPRAVVADELALVRHGLAALLTARGVDVLAETPSGREAASLAAMEAPDLVVLGVLADLPVVEVARRVRRVRPTGAVLALVPTVADPAVASLVALGVAGVVLRSDPPDDLGGAVERVLKGERVVAPALAARLAGTVRPALVPADDATLTAREREVLALLAAGRSNREIAATLSVGLATVKTHLVHIYAKLDATNRNEALGRALALGLIA